MSGEGIERAGARFRFAVGGDGDVVEIGDLDPSDRHALGPYSCPGCGHELVPALGEVRVRHFKHRRGRPLSCSFESYLHQLGKRTVHQAFRRAIAEGRPYPMKVEVPRRCDRYETDLGIVCEADVAPREWDLTRWFDDAELEKGVGGFVADVLLSSGRSDRVMLVEIKVTHGCEQEKIDAGHRIVEIEITDEDDLAPLRRGLDLTVGNTRRFNFKDPKPLDERCRRPCGLYGIAFFVFKSGKTLVLHEPIEEISNIRKRSAIEHFSLIGTDYGDGDFEFLDIYFQETIEAYFRHGAPVKSCLLCRHGALGETEPILCFKTRRETRIASAADCADYHPDSTPEYARRRYERSLAFKERRASGFLSRTAEFWNTQDDEDLIE